MPEPLRTQRYEGLFQSQTQEQFEADARSAAEHDWYPKSEKWTGATLFVEYEHDPGRRLKAAAANAAAQAAPKDLDPDRDPASRKRRVMLLVGAGIAIVAILVVTMVGTQVLGRPAGGGSQTGANPAATPAEAAVALTAPLGTRTAAVELFRTRGYSGVLGETIDRRGRWRGTDGRNSVAEIIGPEERVTEVSLAVRVLRDEKRNNKARTADVTSVFTTFAPLAVDWATDQLKQTSSAQARTAEQQFGDVLVRLVSLPVKGGTVVKFQLLTD